MSHLHQYIPAVEHTKYVLIEGTGETVKVQQDIIHKVLFGGDQFPASRGRAAKRMKANSVSPISRLEGLIPTAEDWHTKLNLLQVFTLFSPIMLPFI